MRIWFSSLDVSPVWDYDCPDEWHNLDTNIWFEFWIFFSASDAGYDGGSGRWWWVGDGWRAGRWRLWQVRARALVLKSPSLSVGASAQLEVCRVIVPPMPLLPELSSGCRQSSWYVAVCASLVTLWLERALSIESPAVWEERSFSPWSNSTSCRCCRIVSKSAHYCRNLTPCDTNLCFANLLHLFSDKINGRSSCKVLTFAFLSSWLEVSPRWADGAVCHRWGLPPADGGHPPRDRQLCPPVLLRPRKKHSSYCVTVQLRLLNSVLLLSHLYFPFHNDLVTNVCTGGSLVLSVAFFCLPSTQGCAMLPAMLLDRWPQTLPLPFRRNSTIRYLKWLEQLCRWFCFRRGYKGCVFVSGDLSPAADHGGPE